MLMLETADLSIFATWSGAAGCLSFAGSQIQRPPFDSIKPCACSSRKRQSMTDLTLSISAALRDAQLQRLEAALASKAAAKTNTVKDKGKPARD